MGAGNKGPKPLHLSNRPPKAVAGVLFVMSFGLAVGGLAMGGLAVGGLGLCGVAGLLRLQLRDSSHPGCRCAPSALLFRHLVDTTDHEFN